MSNHFILITARTNSSRLPNKILLPFSGRNKLRSIDILIKRAQKVKLPIVLATTKLKSDNKLVSYVKKNYKIGIFRGENKNKLKRWHDCFKKFKIKKAIIIDGDDVFFDYDICKKLIKKKDKYEIISAPKNMITGLFTHMLSVSALNKMRPYFLKNQDSEMIEPYIKKAKILVKKLSVTKFYVNKKIRITLDYKEDYKMMNYIYKKFSATTNSIKIIKFLSKKKEISEINYFRENFWRLNQRKKIKKLKI